MSQKAKSKAADGSALHKSNGKVKSRGQECPRYISQKQSQKPRTGMSALRERALHTLRERCKGRLIWRERACRVVVESWGEGLSH